MVADTLEVGQRFDVQHADLRRALALGKALDMIVLVEVDQIVNLLFAFRNARKRHRLGVIHTGMRILNNGQHLQEQRSDLVHRGIGEGELA